MHSNDHYTSPESFQSDLATAHSDYMAEVTRLEDEIAELEAATASSSSTSAEIVGRLVHTLYQHALLKGAIDELRTVERVLDSCLPTAPNRDDLILLKAILQFKLHRNREASQSLASLSPLANCAELDALRADLTFQAGRYEEAEEQYLHLVDRYHGWDHLARLAHFHFTMGHIPDADRLYESAADELTAKQMRSYAWVELQRGKLDFACGNLKDAMVHYTRADRAYTGYWLVGEHLGEVLAAQGRVSEATVLYERLIKAVPRPELKQALGQMYALSGNEDRAHELFASARAEYLQSASRGEVHYYHHLVDLYSDILVDGDQAVKWALRDRQVRQNFSTDADLAWALYRSERAQEAVEYMRACLASGAASANLFRRASLIFRAAGQGAEADQYERLASDLNPHISGFHVHH